MSKPVTIDSNIFNVSRTYASGGSFFLQEKRGLVDTINGQHEGLEKLYKLLKKQDWDEHEFDFITCKPEFATAEEGEYRAMISTIAWQWEADSVAAHHIVPLMAPFVSNESLWALYMEINRNEIVHGRTYSEIVKLSFDNPASVMDEILADTDALRRMRAVANAFGKLLVVGQKLVRGEIDRNSDEARDAIMLGVGTLYILESIQFMASFAVTFAYGNAGKYTQIAKAVQKICADECGIHVRAGEEILKNELATPEGQASWARIRQDLSLVFAEVSENEHNWIDNKLHADPAFQIPGTTREGFHDWVRFCELRTNELLKLDVYLDETPIELMDYIPIWVDLNTNQGSPQEAREGNYHLGGFHDDMGVNGRIVDLKTI